MSRISEAALLGVRLKSTPEIQARTVQNDEAIDFDDNETRDYFFQAGLDEWLANCICR